MPIAGPLPRSARIVLLALGLLCAFPAWASARPITIILSQDPVPGGEAILRSSTSFTRASGDPTQMGRSLTGVEATLSVTYGVTSNLAVNLALPYLVYNSLRLTTPKGRTTRGTTGVGDITLLARYTFFKEDRPGSTLRNGPLLGLKMPTGSDNGVDRLGRIPRPLQPGSGSWDPSLGWILSWMTLKWEIDAQGGYRFNTTADSFSFGDVAFADVSLQYRLWPRQLDTGVPGFLEGVIESNFVWQDEDHNRGRGDPNSGGISWYVDPGIEYLTDRYELAVAVRLPAVQSLNGRALRSDFQLIAEVRWVSFPGFYW